MTIEVPENRKAPAPRMIPLDVAVLPATGARIPGEAIVVLGGGPGGPSIPMSRAY